MLSVGGYVALHSHRQSRIARATGTVVVCWHVRSTTRTNLGKHLELVSIQP